MGAAQHNGGLWCGLVRPLVWMEWACHGTSWHQNMDRMTPRVALVLAKGNVNDPVALE